MVRGRLVAIDGRPVGEDTFSEARAKQLSRREFNLSWRADMPPGNQLAGGRWFTAADAGRGVASVEEGLAKTLGLRIGDRLRFDVAGDGLDLQIVGLRRLDWNSMQVNFFVVTPPGVLERFPASYITTLRAGADDRAWLGGMLREFPNLTVIDVGTMLAQVERLIAQAAAAVELIFLPSLAAGVLVLYAAFVAGFEERVGEIALLRTLGARERQIRQALLGEFAVVGAIAGGLAAAAALAIGTLVGRQFLDLDMAPAWWLLPAAALLGGAFTAGAGSLAARPLLRVPALAVLRRGA